MSALLRSGKLFRLVSGVIRSTTNHNNSNNGIGGGSNNAPPSDLHAHPHHLGSSGSTPFVHFGPSYYQYGSGQAVNGATASGSNGCGSSAALEDLHLIHNFLPKTTGDRGELVDISHSATSSGGSEQIPFWSASSHAMPMHRVSAALTHDRDDDDDVEDGHVGEDDAKKKSDAVTGARRAQSPARKQRSAATRQKAIEDHATATYQAEKSIADVVKAGVDKRRNKVDCVASAAYDEWSNLASSETSSSAVEATNPDSIDAKYAEFAAKWTANASDGDAAAVASAELIADSVALLTTASTSACPTDHKAAIANVNRIWTRLETQLHVQMSTDHYIALLDAYLAHGHHVCAEHMEARMVKSGIDLTTEAVDSRLATALIRLHMQTVRSSSTSTDGPLPITTANESVVSLLLRCRRDGSVINGIVGEVYDAWLAAGNWTGLERLATALGDRATFARLTFDALAANRFIELRSLVARNSCLAVASLSDALSKVHSERSAGRRRVNPVDLIRIVASSVDATDDATFVDAVHTYVSSEQATSADVASDVVKAVKTTSAHHAALLVDAAVTRGCVASLTAIAPHVAGVWPAAFEMALHRGDLALACRAAAADASAIASAQQVDALFALAASTSPSSSSSTSDNVASVLGVVTARCGDASIATAAADAITRGVDADAIQKRLMASGVLQSTPSFFTTVIDRLIQSNDVDNSNLDVARQLAVMNKSLVDADRHAFLLTPSPPTPPPSPPLTTTPHGAVSALSAEIGADDASSMHHQQHHPQSTVQYTRLDDLCNSFRAAGQHWHLASLLTRSDLQSYLTPDDRRYIYLATLSCYADLNMFDEACHLASQLNAEGLDFVEFSAAFAVFQSRYLIHNVDVDGSQRQRHVAVLPDVTRPPPPLMSGVALRQCPPPPSQYHRQLQLHQQQQQHHHHKFHRRSAVAERSLVIERLVKDRGTLTRGAEMAIDMLVNDHTYPTPKVFRFLLNRLASAGEVDLMRRIGAHISSAVKREVSFDNRLCNAYLTAGQGSHFLDMLIEDLRAADGHPDRIEAVKARFPRGGALGLLESGTEACVAKFTELAHSFLAYGYVAPLNVLWTFHFIRGDRQTASDLWRQHVQHCPQIMFQKVCQTARQSRDATMASDLVALLRDAPSVTPGARGIAYSCLLDVHSAVGDYAGGLDRLIDAVESGDVQLDRINRTALVRLRDGVEKMGGESDQHFPYEIPVKAKIEASSQLNSNNNSAEDDDEERVDEYGEHDEPAVAVMI